MSPDGSTKPSPEEKLLRLIREKGAKAQAGTSSQPLDQAGVSHVIVRHVDATAQGLRWSALAVGFLAAVLVFEAVLLVVNLRYPTPSITIPSISSTPPDGTPVGSPQAQGLPPLSQSASHQLFASSVPEQDTPKLPKDNAPSEIGRQLASRLTLMGVVSGDPAQAIIEDSQTKKTYFVSKGQAVVEGATLDQVLDNRVILDLNGEKIELSL